MANAEETIDPNDLDSIDALLDEAEFNMEEELEDAVPDESPEPTSDVEDSTELEEQNSAADEEPELAVEEAPEPEPDILEDLAGDEVIEPEIETPVATQKPVAQVAEDSKKEDEELEKTLAKRAAASQKKSNELTVEEMDKLKKLIIIFGSTSVALLVVAIGIGMWGALSASSAGISSENQTLFESIKVNTDLNAEMARTNTEAADSLEKKIDAINFQIEQLAVDLADVGKKAAQNASQQSTIDPLGLANSAPNTPPVAEQKIVKPAPVVTPARVSEVNVKVNSELTKKVSSVNYKLIKAQRTIDELTKRLKVLQTQQQTMLQSVKSVEKEMLTQRAEAMKAKKAEQEKSKAYQYGQPELYGDPNNAGSYP